MALKTLLLNALEEDWGGYAARFRQLTPAAQAAFLSEQGYVRLADLLAHVLAWWKEGYRALESMLADPDYRTPEYDVDTFNAIAVEAAGYLEEDEVIEAFDAMRALFAAKVAGLSDEALRDARIAQRLKIEIIEHYAEHNLT